jgi:hypothetical protein
MHKKKDKSKILERPLLENLREHINIYIKNKNLIFFTVPTLSLIFTVFSLAGNHHNQRAPNLPLLTSYNPSSSGKNKKRLELIFFSPSHRPPAKETSDQASPHQLSTVGKSKETHTNFPSLPFLWPIPQTNHTLSPSPISSSHSPSADYQQQWRSST